MVVNKPLENALIEINEKLKVFKHQSQKDTSPTTLDIRKFIKEQRCSLHGDVIEKNRFLRYVKKAEDLVVCYLIGQIYQSNSPHDALEILKHTEVGNTPLFLYILNSYLWRSVASMVVSRIHPSDYGRTVDDIATRFSNWRTFDDDVFRTLSRVKQYMGRAESTQIDFGKRKAVPS